MWVRVPPDAPRKGITKETNAMTLMGLVCKKCRRLNPIDQEFCMECDTKLEGENVANFWGIHDDQDEEILKHKDFWKGE